MSSLLPTSSHCSARFSKPQGLARNSGEQRRLFILVELERDVFAGMHIRKEPALGKLVKTNYILLADISIRNVVVLQYTFTTGEAVFL